MELSREAMGPVEGVRKSISMETASRYDRENTTVTHRKPTIVTARKSYRKLTVTRH